MDTLNNPIQTDTTNGRFKRLISQRHSEAMHSLSINREGILPKVDSNGYTSHMPDVGTDNMEIEKASMFTQRDSKKSLALENADQRIKDGSYGVCIMCEKKIPEERLEVMPATELCVQCQTKQEKPTH